MLLFVSIGFGGGSAEATTTTSLKTGTYVVGKDLSTGLTQFSISKGQASIYISRASEWIVYEDIQSSRFLYPNQFTVNLKTGDEVNIDLFYGSGNVTAKPAPKIEVTKLAAGYYEVGTDIPAGTYTLKLDRPYAYDDYAYIEIHDSKYNLKDYYTIWSDDKAFEIKLVKGHKIYVSELLGTIRLKEKTFVPQSLTVNKSTYNITKNQTVKPTVTVSPSDATNKKIIWKSSNPKVATVDSKGNILYRTSFYY